MNPYNLHLARFQSPGSLPPTYPSLVSTEAGKRVDIRSVNLAAGVVINPTPLFFFLPAHRAEREPAWMGMQVLLA